MIAAIWLLLAGALFLLVNHLYVYIKNLFK